MINIIESYFITANLIVDSLNHKNIFNVSNRKIGGIRFIKIGRINLSFSIAKG